MRAAYFAVLFCPGRYKGVTICRISIIHSILKWKRNRSLR